MDTTFYSRSTLASLHKAVTTLTWQDKKLKSEKVIGIVTVTNPCSSVNPPNFYCHLYDGATVEDALEFAKLVADTASQATLKRLKQHDVVLYDCGLVKNPVALLEDEGDNGRACCLCFWDHQVRSLEVHGAEAVGKLTVEKSK